MIKTPTLDTDLKASNGNRGRRAFLSHRIKTPAITPPATRRDTTSGELQANICPPKFNPRRNVTMNASKERQPYQSIARRPGMIWVFGLWTSRNIHKTQNTIKAMGKLIQKTQRHETYSAKIPPMRGPRPPAVAHII